MNGWRDRLTELLLPLGFEVKNPMKRLGLDSKMIVEGDLEDIRQCSGLVAYVPDSEQCRGTSCEIMYAFMMCQLQVLTFGAGHGASHWNMYFAHQAVNYGTLEHQLVQIAGYIDANTSKWMFRNHA